MAKGKAQLLLELVELRAGSIITEAEIRALKKRWHPMGKYASVAYEECCSLMARGSYRIDPAFTERGQRFWQAKLLTKAGNVRKDAFTRALDDEVVNVLVDARRFELIEWEWTSNGHGHQWPYPIIEATDSRGMKTSYIHRPWQSGGVEVL